MTLTAEVSVPETPVPVATDVTFRIRRFRPDFDAEPHWEDYTVALYPTDRVLTALEKIKAELDGSLTFRRSCGHGICGSDAMRINGRNRLDQNGLITTLLIGTHLAAVRPLNGHRNHIGQGVSQLLRHIQFIHRS